MFWFTWAGIHVGVGDGGDEIRRARTARAHAHAGFAGRPRITFGGKTAALLMTRENGADLGMRERLVDFHARAAGIGEDDFHAFAFQRLDKDIATKHRRADLGTGFGFGSGSFLFFDGLAHTFFPVCGGTA